MNRLPVTLLTFLLLCHSIMLQAAAPQVGTFKHQGVDFRYVREGKGVPIVIMGSSASYPRQWFSNELRNSFELVFVDTRHFISSYEPSDQALESLSLETLAEDVEALRTHLAIDKWVVLGHSVQAQIALAYAQKYPERTSHLVMVAGVPYAGPEFSESADSFWVEQASETRKAQHAANRSEKAKDIAAAPASRHFVVNYIADAARFWVDPTFDSTPLWEGVEAGPVLDHMFDMVPSRSQARGILESIDTPTLLILGKLDFAIPHTTWEELILDLPDITYVLLDSVGHNPMTEAPGQFDRELIYWLSN